MVAGPDFPDFGEEIFGAGVQLIPLYKPGRTEIKAGETDVVLLRWLSPIPFLLVQADYYFGQIADRATPASFKIVVDDIIESEDLSPSPGDREVEGAWVLPDGGDEEYDAGTIVEIKMSGATADNVVIDDLHVTLTIVPIVIMF